MYIPINTNLLNLKHIICHITQSVQLFKSTLSFKDRVMACKAMENDIFTQG